MGVVVEKMSVGRGKGCKTGGIGKDSGWTSERRSGKNGFVRETTELSVRDIAQKETKKTP